MSGKLLPCFVLMTLMVFPLVSSADTIYKGTDSHGKTVFSDQPFADGEQIEVPTSQTYHSPPVTTGSESPGKVEQKVSYTLQIVSPQPEQTFTTDINQIEVKISITPALRAGDKIQLLLNGQPYGAPSEATTLTLDSLYRGAYRVQAQIVNMQDPTQPLSQSNEITFYQKRASIN